MTIVLYVVLCTLLYSIGIGGTVAILSTRYGWPISDIDNLTTLQVTSAFWPIRFTCCHDLQGNCKETSRNRTRKSRKSTST